MLNIKFTGSSSVVLENQKDKTQIAPFNQGAGWVEFKVDSTLSKDNQDFYQFKIEGNSTVSVSGTIECTQDYQFYNLFLGCSQITDASNLTFTGSTVKEFCFSNMFKDCTGLVTPPSSLPATTLDEWCYQGMFAGCTNMTTAPALPAETLAKYCYYAMFYGCESLSTAPTLNAETLTDWCYDSMFNNCKSLSSISCEFTGFSPANATSSWVLGVAKQGEFINSNVLRQYGNSKIPSGWTVVDGPLTFTGKSASNAVQLNKNGSPDAISLQYSKNKGTWTNYNWDGDNGQIIELDQNDTVAFSGNNDHFSKAMGANYNFVMTGTIEAKGNIQSLMNFSDNAPNSCYQSLFYQCNSLVTPPALPASDLNDRSYSYMFANCLNLSTAPILPATGMAQECYYRMFMNCNALSTAPQLPATTLAQGCYRQMYYYCTKLTDAPIISATTLADDCCKQMFYGCTSLTSVPTLPALDLASGCYRNMFEGCVSLLTPPQLPATGLATECYGDMFYGCSNLTVAPSLPATTLAWGCYGGMFRDCTSLTDAPQLPATELVRGCYGVMFNNCTSLSSIDVSFTSWDSYIEGVPDTGMWVNGVPTGNVGTFYKPSSLSTAFGYDYIPSGWTVVNK